MDEMKRKQREGDRGRTEQLDQDGLSPLWPVLPFLQRAATVPTVYKGRLPTCHSHSGSLSTAAREAPPHQTKW